MSVLLATVQRKKPDPVETEPGSWRLNIENLGRDLALFIFTYQLPRRHRYIQEAKYSNGTERTGFVTFLSNLPILAVLGIKHLNDLYNNTIGHLVQKAHGSVNKSPGFLQH